MTASNDLRRSVKKQTPTTYCRDHCSVETAVQLQSALQQQRAPCGNVLPKTSIPHSQQEEENPKEIQARKLTSASIYVNSTYNFVRTGYAFFGQLVYPRVTSTKLALIFLFLFVFQVQRAGRGLLLCDETDDDICCKRLQSLEPLGIRHPER